MLQKIVNVEFIGVHRVVEFANRTRDLGREQQKQHDVGDVHLPDARPQPLEGGEKIPAADDRAIDVAGKVSGNEHEALGGIAEAVITKGQPGDDVIRNVIEENHPQPDAAKEVEPQIALDGKRDRRRILIGHYALSILSCWVVRRGNAGKPAAAAGGQSLRHGSQSIIPEKSSARNIFFGRSKNAH
jgi:hypothetical protein